MYLRLVYSLSGKKRDLQAYFGSEDDDFLEIILLYIKENRPDIGAILYADFTDLLSRKR